MSALRSDFVIVGGGSAGSALANRLSADPSNRVLVLEAGRPDYPFDVFIHMRAALTFPIGSRFYDWKYESEPEPWPNGRRVYHARGKVLGGSSSINGMIFQRGNPARLRALGGRPGHGGLGLRALPAVLQADGDLPGRGRRVPGRAGAAGAGARARRQPVVRRVLRSRAAGRLPAHHGRQRVPAGGLRRVRPVQRRRTVTGPAGEHRGAGPGLVRRDAETALHPSCTAKMGVGPDAVVDPGSMRVHGLDGLRVVDASVMPYVTNGNIYAPVMMIAEKAADLILGARPLPAEQVEVYRHGVRRRCPPPACRRLSGVGQTSHVPRPARPVTDPRDPQALRADAPLLDGWLLSTELAQRGALTSMC